MRFRTLAFALAELLVCLLGAAVIAGVVTLLWHLRVNDFAVITIVFGVMSWLPLITRKGR